MVSPSQRRPGTARKRPTVAFAFRLLSLLLLPLIFQSSLPPGTSAAFATPRHAVDSPACVESAPATLPETGPRLTIFIYRNSGESPGLSHGLYYLRARYMNAANGRFWNADSYEGVSNDPVSLHKYLYGQHDPVNRVDPSGRFSLTELSIVTYVQLTTLAATYPLTIAALGTAVASLNLTLFVTDGQFRGEFISAFGPADAGVILAADARLIYQTGSSFFRFLKAVGATANALEQLAALRLDLNLPPPSGRGDVATLSKLEIGNTNFFGISAHGTDVKVIVNPISESHAEIDALNQAFEAGIIADEATLYVDNAMCAACGKNGAVRRVAEQLGLKKLTVRTPSGTTEYIIESNH